MSNGFAGSRSLDDRRRRRIAGNQDAGGPSTSGQNDSASASSGGADSVDGRDARQLPLGRIISSRWWKHALVATLAIACGGILAYLRFDAASNGPVGQHAIGSRIVAELGRFETLFGIVLLILTGQLSLLIGMVRSGNSQDFGGRYSVWRYASIAWFGWAVALGTGLHMVAGRAIANAGGLTWSQAGTLCWLVPSIVCGSLLAWRVLIDMSRNPAGLLLVAASWVMAVGLGLHQLLDEPMLSELPLNGILLAAWVSGFVGLLLHSRYVVHVCSAPPRSAPSHAKATSRQRNEDSSDDTDRLADEQAGLLGVYREESQATDRPKTSRTRTPGRNRHAIDDDGHDFEDDSQPRPRRRKKQVDPIVSADELKGLSKRERRELRKNRRDEQRARRAG